ncbi:MULTISPECIES: triacylglycerol lipase [unclassified Serratia (in: enterobacteria)]|uniref:esterase/lipase family protein n=1 Tax=unclassified Serratia (in: enterobacteria) TaxID=2647522 RepID=UPI0005068FC9|nr:MULTISPECIES: hypothetical protein [unclassified Serratia (in: enterobacteria)]KFK91701.1 hypothetical protein JV45_24900 [Serratia sp. Ag2]KFK92213.1 hypothetical protein IV04_24905 [Serratia sp. Ag1]
MVDVLQKIVVPPAYDENGKLYYPTIMPASNNNHTAVFYKVPDRVIPVIFLPGVMGSNLKTLGTNPSDRLWRLDDASTAAGTDQDPWRLGWLTKGAKDRRTLLDPTKVEVDPEGKVDGNLADIGFTSRLERGWGEAGYMSYGEFLPWLQRSLHDFYQIHEGDRVKLIDMTLDLEMGEAPLTKGEVGLSYKYLFPVHVMGYNWLDSIESSADALLNRINSIISDYNSRSNKCEKVILVTHSMGGLVARYCSELKGGNSKILGIVHGVLPAIGATSAYRRMKAGMEYDIKSLKGKATAEVAGGNGAEMTAVLSQSPGPLQLLPGTEYGMGWLKIKDDDKTHSLPKQDPYSEIYTVRGKWWSLCEDYLIEPKNTSLDKARMDKDWLAYTNIVNQKVKPIIENLKGRYHKVTHSFYGGAIPTHGDLIWQAKTPVMDSWLYKGRERFPLDGRMNSKPGEEVFTTRTVATPLGGKGWASGVYQEYKIIAPTESELGDGTVPLRSSQISERYLRSRARLNVAHEPAYSHPDAQRYTLWAIVKIAQKIKETALRYPDA